MFLCLSGRSRQKGHGPDFAIVLNELIDSDRQQMVQRSEQVESLLREAREARQSKEAFQREEIAFRREDMSNTAAFNNAF